MNQATTDFSFAEFQWPHSSNVTLTGTTQFQIFYVGKTTRRKDSTSRLDKNFGGRERRLESDAIVEEAAVPEKRKIESVH